MKSSSAIVFGHWGVGSKCRWVGMLLVVTAIVGLCSAGLAAAAEGGAPTAGQAAAVAAEQPVAAPSAQAAAQDQPALAESGVAEAAGQPVGEGSTAGQKSTESKSAPAAGTAPAESESWMFKVFWLIAFASAICALVFAWRFFKQMMAADEGTPEMIEIAGYVREGANAYLWQQYKVVAGFFVVIVALLAFAAFYMEGPTLAQRRPASGLPQRGGDGADGGGTGIAGHLSVVLDPPLDRAPVYR